MARIVFNGTRVTIRSRMCWNLTKLCSTLSKYHTSANKARIRAKSSHLLISCIKQNLITDTTLVCLTWLANRIRAKSSHSLISCLEQSLIKNRRNNSSLSPTYIYLHHYWKAAIDRRHNVRQAGSYRLDTQFTNTKTKTNQQLRVNNQEIKNYDE